MDNSKKGAGEDVGTEEGVESRLFCASWMRFLFQIKDEVFHRARLASGAVGL